MTEKSMERKVNFLIGYAVIMTVVCCLLFFFGNTGKEKVVDELTAKRINVVDEKGNLRMVISNEERQHPGVMNGKELPKRGRPSGLIFFNSSGDECGGLVYDGNEKSAGFVFSVDKFGDDQIMQLQYMEDTEQKKRKYGLQIWDYPKENTVSERIRKYEELDKLESMEERQAVLHQMELDSLLMEDRLFVGKNSHNEVGLFINDQKGTPRIKIYVDKDNNPKIEFLNEEGEVIK